MNKAYYLSLRKSFLFVTYFSYCLPINCPKLCLSFLVNHNGFPVIPESSQNLQNVSLKPIPPHLLSGENSSLSIPAYLSFHKHIKRVPASACYQLEFSLRLVFLTSPSVWSLPQDYTSIFWLKERPREVVLHLQNQGTDHLGLGFWLVILLLISHSSFS